MVERAPLKDVVASYVPVVVAMILEDESPELKEYIRKNGKAMAEGAVHKAIRDFCEGRMTELAAEVRRYQQKKW